MAAVVLDKCNVNGPVVTPEGLPIPTGRIAFTLSARDRDDDVTIMPEPVFGDIDADGNISVDLWPNVEGLAGTYYMVRVSKGEPAGVLSVAFPEWRIVVPDLPSANLAAISELVPPDPTTDITAAVAAAQAYALAAQNSATAAGVSEGNAAADAAQTAADRIATAADVVVTNNNAVATNADRIAAAASASAANASAVSAAGNASATAADRVQTGLDVAATHADAAATAADRLVTGANVVTTANNAAQTAADRIQTGADVLTTTNERIAAQGAQVAAETARTGAESAAAGAIVTYQQMQSYMSGFPGFNGTLGQLSPPAVDIVTASDVVDFFIYDTSKDSDGGAWRFRSYATSWFNETLSTATRGGRRQFPSKALIVARAASVTIYDLDQASCPMWMVANRISANSGASSWWRNTIVATSVSALNGNVYFTISGGNGDGLRVLDLVADKCRSYAATFGTGGGQNIASRNTDGTEREANLVSTTVNDVAATVLPGTPIDRVRRLPTPTVGVGTAGGASIVHWDGRVANSATTYSAEKVAFDDEGNFWSGRSGGGSLQGVRRQNYAVTSFAWEWSLNNSGVPSLFSTATVGIAPVPSGVVQASPTGMAIFKRKPIQSLSAVSYLTSKYSTGYMVGDIKLALAESTADLTSLVQGASNFDAGQNFITGPGADQDTGTGVSGDDGTTITLVGTDGSNRGRRSYDLTGLNAAGTYTISGVLAVNSGTLSINIGNAVGNSNTLAQTVAVSGAFSFTFAPGSATRTVTLQTHSTGGDLSITQLKVRERITTVLYDEVNYADGTAATSAGLNYIQTTFGSGSATISDVGGTDGRCSFPLSGLVVGGRYQLVMDVGSGGGNAQIRAGTAANSNAWLSQIISTAAGTYIGYFTATATTGWVHLLVTAADTSRTLNTVRVDRIAEDRSVAGNNPLVYGTVTRSAVATGAEMAAYGGFSANTFFEVPYNVAFDVGTGDLCIEVLYITSTLADQVLMRRSLLALTGARIDLRLSSAGALAAGITDGTNTATATYSTSTADGVWHEAKLVVRRLTNMLELWVDGVLRQAVSCSAVGSLSNNLASLWIGRSADPAAASQFQGRLAQPKFSATAPTPQQIRDIWESNRALFQPNAKCLLPNDSVTALSYDDSTDLLHVATPSGMARLKDLLVVDKDSIVVTGIEARSGIVATRGATGVERKPATSTDTSTGSGTATDDGTTITITGPSSGSKGRRQWQLDNLVIGASYQITYEALSVSGVGLGVSLKATPDFTSAQSVVAVGGSGVNTFTVTATATTMYLFAFNQSGSPAGVATIKSSSVSIKALNTVLGQLPSILIREELLNKGVNTPYDRDRVKGSGVTTNATGTVVGRLPMDKGETGNWSVRVKANQYADGASYGAYMRWFDSFRPEEGNISLRGSVQTVGTDIESTGTMDVSIVANTTTQTFDITVTGIAATNLNWEWEAWRT